MKLRHPKWPEGDYMYWYDGESEVSSPMGWYFSNNNPVTSIDVLQPKTLLELEEYKEPEQTIELSRNQILEAILENRMYGDVDVYEVLKELGFKDE